MHKDFSMKFAHRCDKHGLIFELLTEKANFCLLDDTKVKTGTILHSF